LSQKAAVLNVLYTMILRLAAVGSRFWQSVVKADEVLFVVINRRSVVAVYEVPELSLKNIQQKKIRVGFTGE
jgi:hypothetical protein